MIENIIFSGPYTDFIENSTSKGNRTVNITDCRGAYCGSSSSEYGKRQKDNPGQRYVTVTI